MRSMILAMLVPLAACGNSHDDAPGVPSTGSDTQRSYAVADFTGVELAGPDDVDVRVGGAFSVRAEGAKDVLDRLKIDRDGDTLRIGRVRGFSVSRGHARIVVTMPRIVAADLAGSGDFTVDRAEAARFAGDIAGSGNLTIGTIVVREAKLSIAGSGTIRAGGAADALDVSIAGSGNVEAARLSAKSADISIAGSGDVAATVNGPAKVSLMGSGDVTLGGRPQCQTSKMGSGSVRCGG